MRITFAAIITTLALSGSASAAVPMTVGTAIPANGTVVTGGIGLTFSVTSTDLVQGAHVAVSLIPDLGINGTLIAPFPPATNLPMIGSVPDTYTSVALLTELPPGVWYWQVSYTAVDLGPAPTFTPTQTVHATPVFGFTIARPVPAPVPTLAPTAPATFMTLFDANDYVPRIIRQKTGHPAHGLKRSCKRHSDAAFTCAISWRSTTGLRPSTLLYAGTLDLAGVRGGGASYHFRGLRAAESCVQRKSVKRCARTVRW